MARGSGGSVDPQAKLPSSRYKKREASREWNTASLWLESQRPAWVKYCNTSDALPQEFQNIPSSFLPTARGDGEFVQLLWKLFKYENWYLHTLKINIFQKLSFRVRGRFKHAEFRPLEIEECDFVPTSFVEGRLKLRRAYNAQTKKRSKMYSFTCRNACRSMDRRLPRILRREHRTEACSPSATRPLSDQGRFEVEGTWLTQRARKRCFVQLMEPINVLASYF